MSPRDDDPDGEGFLTRWSRRKRDVLAETSKSGVDVFDPLPPACGGEGLGMGGRAERSETDRLGDPPLHPDPPDRKRGEGEEPSEPEMVEPPSLDLIDKDFDVAHWLKQNVPESWKLAALRRAWESDPAIAGFENPARDYALDWNTPGGAPGYGPLTESDDVEAMVRRIFGEPPPLESPPGDGSETAGDSMPHPLSSHADGPMADAAEQQDAGLAAVRLSDDASEDGQNGSDKPPQDESAFVAAQHSSVSDPQAPRLRKRGGGAMPL